jgi:hypothetical protein
VTSWRRPLAASTLGEPSGTPAWETIPSWAVIGTTDKVIPPALLQSIAQRADGRITDVNAGHRCLISRANTVTRGILKAANATSTTAVTATRPVPRHHFLRTGHRSATPAAAVADRDFKARLSIQPDRKAMRTPAPLHVQVSRSRKRHSAVEVDMARKRRAR